MKQIIKMWLVFVGLAALLGSSSAQDWIGGSSGGDWFDPANWLSVVPGAGSSPNIGGGGGTANATGASAASDIGGPITVSQIWMARDCFSTKLAELNLMNNFTANNQVIVGDCRGMATVNAGPINAFIQNHLWLGLDERAQGFWNRFRRSG